MADLIWLTWSPRISRVLMSRPYFAANDSRVDFALRVLILLSTLRSSARSRMRFTHFVASPVLGGLTKGSPWKEGAGMTGCTDASMPNVALTPNQWITQLSSTTPIAGPTAVNIPAVHMFAALVLCSFIWNSMYLGFISSGSRRMRTACWRSDHLDRVYTAANIDPQKTRSHSSWEQSANTACNSASSATEKGEACPLWDLGTLLGTPMQRFDKRHMVTSSAPTT